VLAICTADTHVANLCNLFRGAVPLLYSDASKEADFQKDVDKRVTWAIKEAKLANFLKDGQKVCGVLIQRILIAPS
jgi:hypothetical protein